MKITARFLQDKGARRDGIEAFLHEFPKGFDLSKWTLEKQIEVLKNGKLRKYFGWAFYNQIFPMWSMSRSNLSGSDLSGSKYSKETIFPAGFDPKAAGAWLVE